MATEERVSFGGNVESAMVSSTVPVNAVKVGQLANVKFRRDRHFSTRLASHGFSRDTSMQRATQAVERKKSQLDHVSDGMNGIITEFYTKVKEVVIIQRQLLTMQRRMAQIALEMLSARRIQHMIRGWMARHLLWKLRVARFIRDRIRFRMYYKRRVRAQFRIRLRVLVFLARRLFKIHLRRKLAAQRIQRLYLKYRLYHRARYRCVILGKVGRLLKHVELFGMRRAIMYMRREEVKRVQCAEQTLYAQILAYEREKAIVEEQAAALRAAEALKAEAEMKEVARLRLEQAKRKQQQKAAAAAGGTAGSGPGTKGKGKPTRPSGPTAAATGTKAAPQPSAGNVVVPDGTVMNTEEVPIAESIQRKHSQPAVAAPAVITVAERPLDKNAVWLAHSLGITAGQASLDALHRFVENRYGSVYGGFYGEYCCVLDNRENSFAAVRFRFMLRCFRKRRLKALAGPHAKAFFYMLSHLNNTRTERQPNKVVLWLQAAVRQQAALRAEALASGASSRATTAATNQGAGRSTLVPNNSSGASGKTLGKLLLNSLQRTRQEAASTSISEELATTLASSSDGPRATINRSSKVGTNTDDDGGGTFLTALTTSASSKHSTSAATSPAKARTTGVAPTFPTYTAENFPRSFVTGCYRPRTFAELIVMLCDLRRAVLRAPSLVDDTEPPNSRATAAGKGTASAKGAALLTAMIRVKKGKEASVPISAKERDRDVGGKDRDKEAPPLTKEAGPGAAVANGSTAASLASTMMVPSTASAVRPGGQVASVSTSTAPKGGSSSGKGVIAPASAALSKKAAPERPQPEPTTAKAADRTPATTAQARPVEAHAHQPSAPTASQPATVVKGAKKSEVGSSTAIAAQPSAAPTTHTAPASVPAPARTVVPALTPASTTDSTGDSKAMAVASTVDDALKVVPPAPERPVAIHDSAKTFNGATAGVSDGSAELLVIAVSTTDSAADSRIPAQLRSHGRILRQSEGVTSLGFTAAPPTAKAGAPSGESTSSGIGTDTGGITPVPSAALVSAKEGLGNFRWPSRATAAESRDESNRALNPTVAGFPAVDQDSRRYIMPSVQSVPPSAIIAAARESVRQAESAAGASGSTALRPGSGMGGAKGEGSDKTGTGSPAALLRKLARRGVPA